MKNFRKSAWFITILTSLIFTMGCASADKKIQSPGAEIEQEEERPGFQMDSSYMPPLHAACNSSHIDKDLIRKLIKEDESIDIDENAYINSENNIRLTPLMIACNRSHIDVEAVKLLIELGADIDEVSRADGDEYQEINRKTALMIACNRSKIDIEAVKTLFEAGADINGPDDNGMTPLMIAVNRSNVDLDAIQAMIELDAEIDLTNHEGKTAAMIAASRPNPNVRAIQILTEHLSDPNAVDRIIQEASAFDANTEAQADMDNKRHDKYMGTWALYSHRTLNKDLAAGMDPNERDNYGFTPLMFARDVNTVNSLIDAGADVNARLDNGASVLSIHAGNDDPKIVRILLEAGATVDESVMAGVRNKKIAQMLHDHGEGIKYTAFNLIMLKEITEAMIREVIENGTDINKPWNKHSGETLLGHACRSGSSNKIKLLLKYAADPNYSVDNQDFGMTPFMFAVSQWSRPNTMDIGTIKALINAGAKVNDQTIYGITPLMYAVQQPHEKLALQVVRLLIESGAEINVTDNGDKNVLFFLNEELNPEIVKYLLDKGANPNQKDHSGNTPIMQMCNQEFVQMLLDAGADINVRNRAGNTPLIANARYCASEKLCKLMVKAGANINAQNEDGQTVLFNAVRRHQSDIVSYLVSAGIDVNIKDYTGKSAIETITDSSSYTDIIQILKNAGATDSPMPDPKKDEIIDKDKIKKKLENLKFKRNKRGSITF